MTKPAPYDGPTLPELEQSAQALRTSATIAAADAAIAADLDSFRRTFTHGDIYVGNEAAEQKYEGDKRIGYDRNLSTELRLFDIGYQKAVADVEARVRDAEQPPAEGNAMLHELREMNLRARFEGTTLRELLAAYLTTNDEDNPTFARMVERDRQTFRLRPEESDALHARTLQEAIEDRRAGRVPAALREEHDKLKALRTASLDALIVYARDGTLAVATAAQNRLAERQRVRYDRR